MSFGLGFQAVSLVLGFRDVSAGGSIGKKSSVLLKVDTASNYEGGREGTSH